MTISSESRISGPYYGSGTVANFYFNFTVFTAADLYVIKTYAATGVDSVLALTADYNVYLNSNQDSTPGGIVMLTAGALPSGYVLTITSAIPLLQQTDITNGGGFYPAVITKALDKLTIICQQIYSTAIRNIRVSTSTPTTFNTQLPAPTSNALLAFNSTATGFQSLSAADLGTLVVNLTSVVPSATGYSPLLALPPANYSAGSALLVTDAGVGGQFTVVAGTTTDNGGTKKTNATWAAANKYLQRTDFALLKASYFGITGTGDETAKGQQWIDAIYALGCTGLLDVPFKATALSLTMTGTRISQSFKMLGASRYNSSITKYDGSSSTLLTFQTSSPTTTPADCQLYIGDISLVGSAKASNGLDLKGVAQFTVERVLSRGFADGLSLQSSLIGSIKSCELTDNTNGLKTRRIGSGAYCNAVIVEDTKIKYNSGIGIDIGDGADVFIKNNCDIEQNGTAGGVTTGGIFVRDTIDNETGFGSVTIEGCHIESNKGWSIYLEGASGGNVTIKDVDIQSPESNRSLYAAAGLRRLSFDNLQALSTGNTVTVNAENFGLLNSHIYTLTNNATNYTIYGLKTPSLDFYCSVKTATAGSDFDIGTNIVTAKNSPKALCAFDGSLTTPITPGYAYNTTNVTKSATGSYVLNITTPVSIGLVQISAFRAGGASCDIRYVTSSTTTYSFTTRDSSGTLVDPTSVNVTIYGT